MKPRMSGAILFILVLIIILSGCRASKEIEAPDTAKARTQSEEKVLEKTEAMEASSENQLGTLGESMEFSDAKTGYLSFLNGETTAVVIDTESLILSEGTYTLEEIADRCADAFQEQGKPDLLGAVSYAMIDCGMDGEPELAIGMEFTTSEGIDSTIEYMVFKLINGRVQHIAEENSYYRTEARLNSAGGLYQSTMYGYSSWDETVRLIDADGKVSFVYSRSCRLLDINIIPVDCLPTDIREELDIQFSRWGDVQVTYTMLIYNFLEPPVGYTEGEDAYNEYLWGNRYTFYDERGESALPEDEIYGLYRAKGILLYEADEADAILKEHKRKIGLTEEIENAPDIEWIELERTFK